MDKRTIKGGNVFMKYEKPNAKVLFFDWSSIIVSSGSLASGRDANLGVFYGNYNECIPVDFWNGTCKEVSIVSDGYYCSQFIYYFLNDNNIAKYGSGRFTCSDVQ